MKCVRTTASLRRLSSQRLRFDAKLAASAVLISSILAAPAYAQQSCSAISLGNLGALNGWVPSPNDAWHQDISAAPVASNSSTIVSSASDLNGAYLHPDFSTPADGGAGIPYTVIDSSTTPLVSINPSDPGDSDNTLYPLTSALPIEGNPGQCWSDGADHHAIVLDKHQCVAYELYQADLCNGSWSSYGNVVWDFTTTEQRPYGLSSTDAAGLSIFEGLLRYDEIVAGSINHALRFTALHTKNDANGGYFTAPATHASANNWSTDNIFGMRIRLKANFDVSGFSSTNQIILNAMKKYGMILADNGSNMFFQGTPDPRWNDSDLHALTSIPATAFEVVQPGPIYDRASAPTGAAPVINSFTASSSTVAPGSSVTLNSSVSGASYQFIDNAGFTRGSVTVSPTQTTTYTLSARNAFGTSTASTTVTVSAAATTTLNFNPIASVTYGLSPFAVSATSNSPGAITYTAVSGPATVAGNIVTVNGVGTVTLRATQAASGSYASASTTTSFTVNGATPSLSFASIPTQTVGSPAFTVSATSKSPGAISYAVVSGPATISGNSVTVTGAGTVTLLASQAAAGNYTSGTTTTSFTAVAPSTTTSGTSTSPGSPTTTSGTSSTTSPGSPTTTSGTSTTSPGSPTTTSGTSTATTGTSSTSTPPQSTTVTPVLTLSSSRIKGGYHIYTTSNSPGAISLAIASGSAYLYGGNVYPTAYGTIVVRATQAASGKFGPASANLTLTVGP